MAYYATVVISVIKATLNWCIVRNAKIPSDSGIIYLFAGKQTPLNSFSLFLSAIKTVTDSSPQLRSKRVDFATVLLMAEIKMALYSVANHSRPMLAFVCVVRFFQLIGLHHHHHFHPCCYFHCTIAAACCGDTLTDRQTYGHTITSHCVIWLIMMMTFDVRSVFNNVHDFINYDS